MCFVWIWEQTAIISLYSINWLVLITETEFVYRAVRTEFWSVIQVSRNLDMLSLSLIKHHTITALEPSCHYMYRQV